MKKVLSLLLVLVLALGMSTVAFAAGADTAGYLWPQRSSTSGGAGGWSIQDDELIVQDGNKIKFPITFADGKNGIIDGSGIDGSTATPGSWGSSPSALAYGTAILNEWARQSDGIGAAILTKDLNKGKVSFKISIKEGSKAFDNISVKDEANSPKMAYVILEMADPFVSTADDTTFRATIVTYVDGKKANDLVDLDFVYRNEIEEVDGDSDYVDISNGTVIDATEYNKLCEVEVGENISVWTKLFKDKKYYGYADRDDDETDLTIYTKYPDVDSVVTIKSIGLSSTAQYVTFNDYDDTFFVYDANMKYLGKSNEKVAFSTKYYLANKMLDVDEDDVEPDDEDSDLPEAPSVTGGEGYPENVNDNPGTGK